MRKTKIICTIGPASESEEMLRSLMSAGMDVARLNFSHGSRAEQLAKIETIKRSGMSSDFLRPYFSIPRDRRYGRGNLKMAKC